jgi:hypothetical protein
VLPQRGRARGRRGVLPLTPPYRSMSIGARAANALRRVAIAMGYIPNKEWFRAGLSRAVALDRARAHIAIAECERALRLRRRGIPERCFGPLRR